MEEKETRRKEEEDRKKQERLREVDTRETRLEARLGGLLTRHMKVSVKSESSGVKTKLPKTKARVLREIISYFDESKDDSEEVKEEGGKLIEAIERRKGKRGITQEEGRVSRIKRRGHKVYPIRIDDDEERTTPPTTTGNDEDLANLGVLDFDIELHKHLSEKKVLELRKLCNSEGIEWSKKDAIGELVKTKHFDLKSMDELRKQCEEIQQDLCPKGDEVLARSYDIKDMFAQLSHKSVLEAVDWVIMWHERRGMRGLRVSQRGKLCAMVKRVRKEEGIVILLFDDIRREVAFELSRSYVRCMFSLLMQEFEIPMGRNSSPALACLVCIRDESAFLERMTGLGAVARGIRMIDDVEVLVGFMMSGRDTIERVVMALDEFKNCYDGYLKLVQKDDGGNVFDFLGARIFVEFRLKRIDVHPKAKNQQCLLEKGKLRIQSMQDFTSFTRKASKNATVYVLLIRMNRISSSDKAMKLRLQL
ncbi:hypothetical protein CBR_g22177 [Chara braunii]|uniref:Uncharacterized protein n=1 Tax=Chara braunii TaxID=69332 RepID=A0A388L2A1_CHABU|nr:hypothetical protein CBR_g22177 [Chara braunii]|eukprot:GBG76429.1 hypothetical protein CBR_g22177 [Chara braunii]